MLTPRLRRPVAPLAIAMLGLLVVGGCDRAKRDYDECVRLGNMGSKDAAAAACRKAVAADPKSESGQAAQLWLDPYEATQQAATAASARAAAASAQAAADSLRTKYMALSPNERHDALENCFAPKTACGVTERETIVAAGATDEERNALRKFIDARTPTNVDFDQLKKIAATGMTVGKPYKICAYYYANDVSEFCKMRGRVCEDWITVEDNFLTGSEELKSLYDRRGKTSCFEVKMFRGGILRITALL